MTATKRMTQENRIESEPTFVAVFLPLIGVCSAAVLVVAAAGYWPTRRICGDGAALIVVLGCGASWLASCIGAIPLALCGAGARGNGPNAIMGGTALRFAVVLATTLVLVFGTGVERTPLVAWIAISYLWLLPVETYMAVRLVRRFVKTSDS